MKKALFLIVLAVGLLALLSAAYVTLVLPSCVPQKPRVTAAILDRMDTAMEAFLSDTGTYPLSLAELLESDKAGWDGPYITSGTLRDPWDNQFIYSVSETGGYYVLLSFGAGGKPGGVGVDADIISKNSGPGL